MTQELRASTRRGTAPSTDRNAGEGLTQGLTAPLTARDFPPGTPLHQFFVWNEAALVWRDRRYQLARRPERQPKPVADALRAALGNADPAAHAAVFAAFEQVSRPAGET